MATIVRGEPPIFPLHVCAEFVRLIDRSAGPDACHPWLGGIDISSGYGHLKWKELGPDKHRPHVITWEMEHGDKVPRDPETGRKLDVDHICHNIDTSCPGGKNCLHRRCCNGKHLEVKTPKQNLDAADEPRKRGRYRTHFDCGCEITPENTYLIERKGLRNGKPRGPERRCKRHEREKQNSRAVSSAHDRLP